MLLATLNLFLASLPAASPALTAPTTICQENPKELRRLFREKLAKVDAKDAEALYAIALWAERKKLVEESRRALKLVVKADPAHVKAHEKLGHVRLGKRWLDRKNYERLKKKEEEADYKKRGFVEHDGKWVKKEELVFLELGYRRHDGRWLRAEDAEKLAKGMVPHPETGEFIDAQDLEKAKKGLFPYDGEWIPLEEANRAHGAWESPWRIYTDNLVVESTYELEKASRVALEAETSVSIARNLILDPSLPLPRRVPILLFGSQEEYASFGAQFDDTGFSSYGTFYAGRHDDQPIAVYHGEQGWGDYYLKHAGGFATSIAVLGALDVEATHWIHTGFASYVERWSNSKASKHFGPQYLNKGGIRNLKSFWRSFGISGEQSSEDMQWNIYQAGIAVSYAISGKNKKVLEAWEKLREAVRAKRGRAKAAAKALKLLEKRLTSNQQGLRDHLAALIRG